MESVISRKSTRFSLIVVYYIVLNMVLCKNFLSVLANLLQSLNDWTICVCKRLLLPTFTFKKHLMLFLTTIRQTVH